MNKRKLSPQEEDELAKRIAEKVKALMVPSQYDRFLTIHIDREGGFVGMAISLKEEIAIGRTQ